MTTKNNYGFKSVFADEMTAYVDSKVAGGFKARSFTVNLRKFDKYCCGIHLSDKTFTASDASGWLPKRDSEAVTSHYSRVNTSKNFLKYLSLKGYDVYVVRDVRFIGTDFKPHIYTEDEVRRYFYQVDHFYSSRNKKDAVQYPVLFRTLYCCGTRINETLCIRKKDVDLEKGIILLTTTKSGKQRMVVMGEDLRRLYCQFAERTFYLLSDNDYIFTNSRGKKIDGKTIYEHHRVLLKRAGIPYVGGGEGPRVHDWRHHFMVYSFKQLSDSGLDMYTALPILSTYAGHKTIFATEKYLRLTIELFPYIKNKIQEKAEIIFGGTDNEDD